MNSNGATDRPAVKILSGAENYKYFKLSLTEEEIIDVMSDFKHRIFPRPFERLSSIKNHDDLIGAEIGVADGEHALSPGESFNQENIPNRSI